jgi:uncharacterized cupredoxin-like copper-binding protein
MNITPISAVARAAVLALLASYAPAWANPSAAHTEHQPQHHQAAHGSAAKLQKDWGIAGKANASTRTVQVEIDQALRFMPNSVVVKRGETLRFVVKNSSVVNHEFVLGTKEENQQHAEHMLKNPGMVHTEQHQASIAADKTSEVVWTFNRAGNFEFACMVPGHYQLGMVGKIQVATKR